MTSIVKKSVSNVSLAATALLATLMQFGIISCVYTWTGKKMPKWLARTLACTKVVSRVSTLIALFCPVAWWIKVAIAAIASVTE